MTDVGSKMTHELKDQLDVSVNTTLGEMSDKMADWAKNTTDSAKTAIHDATAPKNVTAPKRLYDASMHMVMPKMPAGNAIIAMGGCAFLGMLGFMVHRLHKRLVAPTQVPTEADDEGGMDQELIGTS